jgi:hypothetical protein
MQTSKFDGVVVVMLGQTQTVFSTLIVPPQPSSSVSVT